MEKIKTIIVDDIEVHQELLRYQLESYSDEVSIVGTVNSVMSAIKIIELERPNLVFLDIKIRNEETFFNVIDHYVKKNDLFFKVIFFSAHLDDFSRQILNYTNIGVLEKPINKPKLEKIMNDFLHSFNVSLQFKKMEQFLELYRSGEFEEYWIPLLDRDNSEYKIALNEIVYFEADGNISRVYITSQEKPLISNKSLKYFDEDLSSALSFKRLSRSFIINENLIKKKTAVSLIFKNDMQITLDRRTIKKYVKKSGNKKSKITDINWIIIRLKKYIFNFNKEN